MTSTPKSGITADLSGLVEHTPADAADVLNPITDLLNHVKSGATAVSADDTHVKHLEDAITVGAGLSMNVLNPGANEQIALTMAGNIDAVIIGATMPAAGRFTSSALAASTELTIAGGAVTAAQSYHRIDTEGDAASDDLDTINGGGPMLNRLIIRAEDGARAVHITTAGNILTPDGNPIALNGTHKMIELVWDAGLSKWVVIWDGGGGGLIPAENANTVYAGPTGGGPATPGFRALVTADIPWGTPGAIGTTTPDAGTFSTLAAAPATELTIASGAITPTQTYHIVDTEADAAQDDLTTITAGVDGQLLILEGNASRQVVIKPSGNITIPNLSVINATDGLILNRGPLLLVYSSATAKWIIIGRQSDNAASVRADTGQFDSLTFFGAAVNTTIISGIVNASSSYVLLAAETGTTDDLVDIAGGNTGAFLILGAQPGHTITLKTAGNIATPEGDDIVLSGTRQTMLVYGDSKWRVMWGGTESAISAANQSLGNLTSPTAVNQDLIPSGTRALGSSSTPWDAAYTSLLNLSVNGAPPVPPASEFNLYAKADGIYYKDSSGIEYGPLGESTTSDANTSLSNLNSPTAVSQSLIPAAPITIGSASAPWENVYTKRVTIQEVSAPATPPAGLVYIYVKPDGGLYYKDDAGIEYGPLTANTGTVTSVGLSVPSEFGVSGSPVVGAGTLTLTKAAQSANRVYAGPTGGGAAQPTFRALVAADMPAGTGTVTSVGLSMPSEFSVTGTPVSSSGTLAVSKAVQSANRVFAGPTGGGAAQPAFRALVAADLPVGTDLRVRAPASGVLTTVDATGTWIYATPVLGVGESYAVEGSVWGERTGSTTHGIVARLHVLFTRSDTGVGGIAAQIINQDFTSGGTPSVNIGYDAGSQRGYLYVIGLASQTWNWVAFLDQNKF